MLYVFVFILKTQPTFTKTNVWNWDPYNWGWDPYIFWCFDDFPTHTHILFVSFCKEPVEIRRNCRCSFHAKLRHRWFVPCWPRLQCYIDRPKTQATFGEMPKPILVSWDFLFGCYKGDLFKRSWQIKRLTFFGGRLLAMIRLQQMCEENFQYPFKIIWLKSKMEPEEHVPLEKVSFCLSLFLNTLSSAVGGTLVFSQCGIGVLW